MACGNSASTTTTAICRSSALWREKQADLSNMIVIRGFPFGFRLQSREMRNAAFEASWCLRMVSRHIRGSSSDIAASKDAVTMDLSASHFDINMH